MREILFRGKRIDNGEFVYGYVGVFKGKTQIYVPFTEEEEKENEGHIFSHIGGMWHTVHPETVGQYIGRTDRSRTKIFEGDIVECVRTGKLLTVERFVLHESTFSSDFYDYSDYEMEVIGNIYNNHKTNGDRIREMSDEALALNNATLFANACKCKDPSKCTKEKWDGKYSPCAQCVLEWLKQAPEE